MGYLYKSLSGEDGQPECWWFWAEVEEDQPSQTSCMSRKEIKNTNTLEPPQLDGKDTF